MLFTPDQVAEHLGLSRRAVLDLARAYIKGDPRGLPGVKVAKEWRFTLEDVTVFVEANRSQSASVAGRDVEVPARGDRREEPTGLKSRRSALLR